MTATDLHFVMLTLQQYLVELGLYLNCEAMDWISFRDVYDTICYRPLRENTANIQGLTGFNLCELHRHLLKFWYYSDKGILNDINYPCRYLNDFLTRIDVLLATDTMPAIFGCISFGRH